MTRARALSVWAEGWDGYGVLWHYRAQVRREIAKGLQKAARPFQQMTTETM